MRAINAAMQIVAQIKTNTTKTGDKDKEEDNLDPVTTMQRDCHLLLTFLWAAANGFSQNIPLTNSPGTPIFHGKGQQLMDRIDGLPATSAGAVTGTPVPVARIPPSRSPIDALLPALIQNQTASTAMFLKTANREAQKKDILSKLATDFATSFTALLVEHWRDTEPVLNCFTA
jgi:hypothetical protein